MREDSLNVSCRSKLYFFYSMLQGGRLDLGSFLVNQLHSAFTSSAQRIVIGGLITPIARFVRILLNLDDRVFGSKWLNLVAFEQMMFSNVEVRHFRCIYPRSHLMPLPNVDRTTLLNRANLYFRSDDEALAQPAPPPPSPHLRASSSSQLPTFSDYAGLHAALLSIQEKQASLQAYTQTDKPYSSDFIQEWHDGLCGMIVSQN